VAVADHLRYLELRLAGFVPASIHAEQIAAYTAAADAARRCDTEAELASATNRWIELTRSEWIDRHDARARLMDALGDPRRARLDRDSAGSVRGPANLAGLLDAMAADGHRANPLRYGIPAAAGQIPGLVTGVIDHRVEQAPERRAELGRELGDIWRAMTRGDPALEPSHLLEVPTYRFRLPFSDRGVETLVRWLGELELPAPEPVDPGPPPPPIQLPPPGDESPGADQVAAGYRAAAAGVSGGSHFEPLRAIYRRVDEIAAGCDSAAALMAAMAAEDIGLELARESTLAPARTARAEIAAGQRGAAAHYDALIADLEAARSVAEIELISAAAEEHLAAETAWAQTLFAVALRPPIAALAHAVAGSERTRAELGGREAAAIALFGVGTPALLATPAIWDVFAREVAGRGQRLDRADGADPQAWRGEVALDLADRVRPLQIQWAIAEAGDDPRAVERLAGRPRFATAEAMRAHIFEVLARVGAPAGQTRWPLMMWGSPVELERLTDALVNPPRPPLSLCSAVSHE
jgi:hypothetical protein